MSINYWIGVYDLAEFAPKVIKLLDDIFDDVKFIAEDRVAQVEALREKIKKIKPKNISFYFGFEILNNGREIVYVKLMSMGFNHRLTQLIPDVNCMLVRSNKANEFTFKQRI